MPARKSILDRIRAMFGDGDAAARLDLESLISELESERQMMTGMISDLREMDGYASAWDQAASVLQNGITELEQDIDAARQELEAIAAGVDDPYKGVRRARQKKDDRDYSAEIAAAAAELEGLRSEAEALLDTPLTSEDIRSEVVRGLADISQRLTNLYFQIPVSDFNAKPIEEGRALSDEVTEMQAWLDEQWGAINAASINDDGAPTLHSIVDGLERAA